MDGWMADTGDHCLFPALSFICDHLTVTPCGHHVITVTTIANPSNLVKECSIN